MPQVTLYLDSETESKMARAAASAGVSRSRWVRDLIQQETTAKGWPADLLEALGTWRDGDFPTVEEIRSGMGEDVPRKSW